LQQLTESGQSFDAVADLCEMSAKGDPALKHLAGQSELRIAACYPRAVKWLFSSAGVTLPQDAQVLNMREQTGEEIMVQLLSLSSARSSDTVAQGTPSGDSHPSMEGDNA
jgi:hypothetical protein